MSQAADIGAPRLGDLMAKAASRARHNPVWFAEDVLQLKQLPDEPSLDDDPMLSWEMDDWTKELLDAVADVVRKRDGVPTVCNHKGLNQITVRAMHGPGKTFGLACLMHWFGFCFSGKIPMTAPKMDQLKRRLWPEFRKIRNRAIPGYKELMEVKGESVHWMGADGQPDPDHWAFMETASAPENLAGLHDRYMLIGVDEATGVDEVLWPVIESAISTGVVVILVTISNPTKMIGTFAWSHLRPIVRKDWYTMHISLDKTKRVSRDWVQRMVDKYGENSPVVRVRCYGEFASEDENQLIAMQWIEDARNKDFDDCYDGSIPRQRISVDVADGGANFTVLTHASHYQSFTHYTKQTQHSFPAETSHVMCADAVEEMWNLQGMTLENGDTIVVDAVGVGSGVASILIDRGFPVIRYKGGAASDDKVLYRNRRVQSYLTCRDEFRNGDIVFDDDFTTLAEWDDVIAQLCSIRRNPNTGERIEDLLTKKEMVTKGIISPDRADSIAMQYATQLPALTSGVTETIAISGIAERYDAGLT
jgi:hypothetical protein